jgi:RsiW-degrading membrane proteinase PrsW (M82 family)
MYPIYLLFLSIIPGLIWLFYFLFKDEHPEPKGMVLKIFFCGMISAFPAVLLEWGIQKITPYNNFGVQTWQYYLFAFAAIVFGVALVEELSKYFAVRIGALRSPEMDEPMDVILYMIIAALGFATIENIFLFIAPEIFSYTFLETFYLAIFRFISATFLHALCSGTIGFFMALSFWETKRKNFLMAAGFTLAVLLHGLYNFSIMKLEGFFRFGVPLIIILGLAIFIYLGIGHLKKLKSICKIK